MSRHFLVILLTALLTLSFTAVGCGSDEDSTENNSTENNSTENNSTENNSTENNSTENNSTENNSTENNSTENNSTEEPEIPGPVASCEEAETTACFANADCGEEQRCQNIGADGDFVSCCVTAPRGTLQAGEACDEETGELQCASSLCISNEDVSLCSTTCETSDDCPEGMKDCRYIAGSGSDFDFCFPSSEEDGE